MQVCRANVASVETLTKSDFKLEKTTTLTTLELLYNQLIWELLYITNFMSPKINLGLDSLIPSDSLPVSGITLPCKLDGKITMATITFSEPTQATNTKKYIL